MKKIIIALIFIIFAVIIVLRFSSPEDTWLCQNNQWVKHGNPRDPAPTTGCGPAPMVGSDKDEHGCIGSAGYTWCPIKNKCLRTWEEPCQ
jgi:hypothetical protein